MLPAVAEFISAAGFLLRQRSFVAEFIVLPAFTEFISAAGFLFCRRSFVLGFLNGKILFAFRTFQYHSDPFFLNGQCNSAMRTFDFKLTHGICSFGSDEINNFYLSFNVIDPNKYFLVFKKNSKIFSAN